MLNQVLHLKPKRGALFGPTGATMCILAFSFEAPFYTNGKMSRLDAAIFLCSLGASTE